MREIELMTIAKTAPNGLFKTRAQKFFMIHEIYSAAASCFGNAPECYIGI
jgi:hypothetical protein